MGNKLLLFLIVTIVYFLGVFGYLWKIECAPKPYDSNNSGLQSDQLTCAFNEFPLELGTQRVVSIILSPFLISQMLENQDTYGGVIGSQYSLVTFIFGNPPFWLIYFVLLFVIYIIVPRVKKTILHSQSKEKM